MSNPEDSNPGKERRISWLSMARTVRVSVISVALVGLGFLLLPQTRDMLADIKEYGASAVPGATFHLALLFLALSAWAWARAALAERFGDDGNPPSRRGLASRRTRSGQLINARVYDELPRILFAVIAIAGAFAAWNSDDYIDAALALAWGAGGYVFLVYRLRIAESLSHPDDTTRAPPPVVTT